jgi:hypothetical protein
VVARGIGRPHRRPALGVRGSRPRAAPNLVRARPGRLRARSAFRSKSVL